MPRRRNYGSGSIVERDGKLYARVSWIDASGKQRRKERLAKSRTHAGQLCDRMLAALRERGEQWINAERMLFRDAAEEYRKKKLIEAIFRDGRKIAGLRSWKYPNTMLNTLIEHFGGRHLRAITHADIEEFKLLRLQTMTRLGTPLKLASVNRELALLRSLFNFCRRARWIADSPFAHGESLIQASAETQRDRILTSDEEARLLSVCAGRREHLRAVIICALDTAMRRGEMFRLTWNDLDLDRRLIFVRATTAKSERARVVGMTERLHAELLKLRQDGVKDADRVFGITDHVKRAFATACRLVGIEGLRWHDLRHTATTRLVCAGLAAPLAMKITGHTQSSTFNRYVNTDALIATQAAKALDRMKNGHLADSKGEQKGE